MTIPVSPDTADLYRVYRPEWIVVYFVTASGDDDHPEPLLARAQEHFAAHYHGRVRDEDVRFQCSGAGINAVVQLQLRLPNVKAEFASLDLADAYVRERAWADAVVVARNSRDDHSLRQYGVRKLPA